MVNPSSTLNVAMTMAALLPAEKVSAFKECLALLANMVKVASEPPMQSDSDMPPVAAVPQSTAVAVPGSPMGATAVRDPYGSPGASHRPKRAASAEPSPVTGATSGHSARLLYRQTGDSLDLANTYTKKEISLEPFSLLAPLPTMPP